MAPAVPDVVEDTLLCLVDKLCRRSMELVLAGRGPDGPRPATLARISAIPACTPSAGRFPPTAFLSAVCESKLKSFDAVAILLCRSSKLGEGRKS